jgi:hypothetical protein
MHFSTPSPRQISYNKQDYNISRNKNVYPTYCSVSNWIFSIRQYLKKSLSYVLANPGWETIGEYK